MKTVKLRNGSTLPAPIVVTTMMALEKMCESIQGLTSLDDLNRLCNGEDFDISSDNLEYLKSLALVQSNGQPHNSVKDVVKSAIQGEGLAMEMVSPYAPEQ